MAKALRMIILIRRKQTVDRVVETVKEIMDDHILLTIGFHHRQVMVCTLKWIMLNIQTSLMHKIISTCLVIYDLINVSNPMSGYLIPLLLNIPTFSQTHTKHNVILSH